MDAQKEKDQQEFDAKLKAWSKQIKKLDKREGVQLENPKVKSAKHCIEDKHVSLKGYNPHEIREGIEEEHEHTSNLAAKKQMVHDHLKSDPKYYTHLDEMETKTHTEKDHMKEAFERGFMKAAMAHGVEPLMAVELLKYAAPSMTQVSNDRTPSPEDMYSYPLQREDYMTSLFSPLQREGSLPHNSPDLPHNSPDLSYNSPHGPSTYDQAKGMLQHFGTNTLPVAMDNMSTNVIPRVGDYMKTNHIPEKMDNFRTNTLPNLKNKMMGWLKP